VGLLSFATLSNGEQIDNPRFYRRDEADLKRAQKLKDAAKNAQKWDENRHRKRRWPTFTSGSLTGEATSPTSAAVNW